MDGAGNCDANASGGGGRFRAEEGLRCTADERLGRAAEESLLGLGVGVSEKPRLFLRVGVESKALTLEDFVC